MKVYQAVFSKPTQLTKAARCGYKIALIFLLSLGILLPAGVVQAQQNRIFMPMVLGPAPNNIGAADSAQLASCPRLTSEETDMARKFLDDNGQRRPVMRCNPTLSAVARARAQDMANRRYFGHINPDGIGPDTLAERAGYNLPEWYDVTRSSNHIESIAAGTSYPTAEAAWNALMTSSTHRTHLRGQTSFFAEQSEFGIGYAYASNTRYKSYWVIISAHPSE